MRKETGLLANTVSYIEYMNIYILVYIFVFVHWGDLCIFPRVYIYTGPSSKRENVIKTRHGI